MPWPEQPGATVGHRGEQPDLGPGGPAPTGPGPDQRQPELPSSAAWWAVPGAIVGILLAGIGANIGYGLTHSKTGALTELLGEIGLWTAMLGTALFVSRRYGTADLGRDYRLAFKPKDVMWGAAALVAALIVVQVVLQVFAGTKFAGSNDEILTDQKGHELGIVVVSLLVALGAPFFEELFFRGFLRSALQARFGGHGAVLVQAVFFGLAHFGEAGTTLGNVSVVLAMMCVGVVLGYTAKFTGRLGAGMVAHCLFNLVAVVTVL